VKFIIVLNVISIFLLAKSLLGILFLLLTVSTYVAFHILRVRISTRFLKQVLISQLLIVLVSFFAYQYVENSRFAAIIVSAADNPIDIFSLDASMNERLEHVVFSIHGTVANYFVPSGFDTFADHHAYLKQYYDGYFWWEGPTSKIMSWVGDFLYHLGIFGVGALLVLFFFMGSDGSSRRVLERVLLFVLLLSAVPVAFPLVSMLFALFSFQGSKRTELDFTGHGIFTSQKNHVLE
jgi:hypothetical protein